MAIEDESHEKIISWYNGFFKKALLDADLKPEEIRISLHTGKEAEQIDSDCPYSKEAVVAAYNKIKRNQRS